MTDTPPPATLRILCLGGDDLRSTLGDGASLRAAIIDHRGGSPDIEVVAGPDGPLADVLEALDSDAALLDGVHVVLRSVRPDLDSALSLDDLSRTVRPLLERLAATTKAPDRTVVMVAVSTFDPAGPVVDLRARVSTPSLAAHQMNIELIRLSMLDGISLVDVDRIVAERGGRTAVPELFALDTATRGAVIDELAAILDEYGWFDDRPILRQQGQRAKEVG